MDIAPDRLYRLIGFIKELEEGMLSVEAFRGCLRTIDLPDHLVDRLVMDFRFQPPKDRTEPNPLAELVPMIESMMGTMRYQTAALEITKLAATTGKPVNVIIGLYRDSLDRLREEYPAREVL